MQDQIMAARAQGRRIPEEQFAWPYRLYAVRPRRPFAPRPGVNRGKVER